MIIVDSVRFVGLFSYHGQLFKYIISYLGSKYVSHKTLYQQLSLTIPSYYFPAMQSTRQYYPLHYIIPCSSTTAYTKTIIFYAEATLLFGYLSAKDGRVKPINCNVKIIIIASIPFVQA